MKNFNVNPSTAREYQTTKIVETEISSQLKHSEEMQVNKRILKFNGHNSIFVFLFSREYCIQHAVQSDRH